MKLTPSLQSTFAAANGITFRVRVVRIGERYGREMCLTHKGTPNHPGDPLVEFYDTRHPQDHEFAGTREDAKSAGVPPLGQFVARYYLSTLTHCAFAGGLCLQGGVPDWSIDSHTLALIRTWLAHHQP